MTNFSSVCKRARRLGTDPGGLKSRARDLESKCKLGTPPGQHGAKKVRTSEYGLQLKAKQLFKLMYGVLEKQFRIYYKKASMRDGATGENLLQLLESRLDNVVYRVGFGATRAEARQLVRHKAILVNSVTVNIPSYSVSPGDVIEIHERAKEQVRIQDSMRVAESAGIPEWLELNSSSKSGTFKRLPDRNELPTELNEQLVVELYSK
jgi:small subunit ribosomal protein S4